MYLSKEEERMLNGEYGEVIERNFRLLVKLGDIYGADRMLPVSSVQVAGVSYKSIGQPGLEFLEDYAKLGAKVKILTYLNPAGTDLERGTELGFDTEFVMNQMRIINAFRSMGVVISATCTPYLAGNLPRYGEHIAWSESSAVSYANSVLGARTNREGGPSALASAICGVTPNYGLHLESNRSPEIIIDLHDIELNSYADFGAVGYYVGKEIGRKIPYFRGLKHIMITGDQLKSLGAAMAATGAVALYHIEGVTPEASRYTDMLKTIEERIEVTNRELRATYDEINAKAGFDNNDSAIIPEIIILGCPHASIRELLEYYRLLKKGNKLKIPVWICSSRTTCELAMRIGIGQELERRGCKLIADTCMVVAPIETIEFKTTGVNSGKAAYYLPSFCKQKVIFRPAQALLENVIVT